METAVLGHHRRITKISEKQLPRKFKLNVKKVKIKKIKSEDKKKQKSIPFKLNFLLTTELFFLPPGLQRLLFPVRKLLPVPSGRSIRQNSSPDLSWIQVVHAR